MQTAAVRLYGQNDIRLETFELRDIHPDEALARVVCDSVCMSTHKTMLRGKPKVVYPAGCEDEPVMIGHELAAEIVRVGAEASRWCKIGDRFGVQAAMLINGEGSAPGYNYPEFGGAATYIIVPGYVLSSKYIMWFDDMPYFRASLGEPFACLLYALHCSFHTERFVRGLYTGIRENGSMAIMGGCGPMGIGLVELVLSMDRKPRVLVVTDIDEERIRQAESILPQEYAAQKGVILSYTNTAKCGDPVKALRALTRSGAKASSAHNGDASIGYDAPGFDDIFIMCPVASVIEMADALCAYDCCINFFSGPVDTGLSASINFHAVHYNAKHIVGSASSGALDMREVLDMMRVGRLRPEVMVTHIGGLGCVAHTVTNLPRIPGGKKLIYTGMDLPLTAIADFGKSDDCRLRELDLICKRNDGLWSADAEEYLLREYSGLNKIDA